MVDTHTHTLVYGLLACQDTVVVGGGKIVLKKRTEGEVKWTTVAEPSPEKMGGVNGKKVSETWLFLFF